MIKLEQLKQVWYSVESVIDACTSLLKVVNHKLQLGLCF